MCRPSLKELFEMIDFQLPYARLDRKTLIRYKAVLITKILSGCEAIVLPSCSRGYGLINFLENAFPDKNFILDTCPYFTHGPLLFYGNKKTIFCCYDDNEIAYEYTLRNIYGHNVCYLHRDYELAYKGWL